jgi:hypothetical protein
MIYILQDSPLLRFLGIEDISQVKESPLVLYHGTNLDAVKNIMTQGFKILPCKCEGGENTTELASNKIFSFENTENCICRMMGKGIYGCSFFRAAKFAQAKFGRTACVLRFVVNKKVDFYTVKKEDTCGCPCSQSFVDHCGKLIEKYGAVHLKNDSLPATTSPEWVVGNEKMCTPLNYIYFPPRSDSKSESDSRSETNEFKPEEYECGEILS